MGLGVEVGKTHGVGAGHDHVAGGDKGFEFRLQCRALGAGFGKARGIDDDGTHALGRAAAQHGRDVRRRQGQHDQIGRGGQCFQIRPAAQAEDFLVFRVDGIDGALVAELGQMGQGHAADAGGIVAGAHHGNGGRVEQGIESVLCHGARQ
ncbi:hypothetical protein D3C78_1322700 [compost metagenome]